LVVDAYNSIRCKVVPLDQCAADTTVAIAKVCFAGLPTFGDVVLPDTGLKAKGVLLVTPDYGTLRILPYADATAVVFGTAHQAPSRQGSTMCTRGLLSRVTATAKTKHGIHFNVGAELEFSLFAIASGKPVDNSLFASATTLNQQDAFITDCYVQLRGQSIDVEQLHSESGPGQLEMVIKHQPNPLFLVDQVVLARETIQAVARKHGCIANFLPKTFDDKAGNGLHLHLSFGLPNLPNAFPDPASPHSISTDGQSFVEGILQHLRGLLAVPLGSNNSFRRVGPGCWTGHQVAWDIEDKEVPLRVCMDLKTGSLTNVEFHLKPLLIFGVYPWKRFGGNCEAAQIEKFVEYFACWRHDRRPEIV
jgi:glutamine synthetase